jgi:DNA-binding LacI/PurR family transcriptional regulator
LFRVQRVTKKTQFGVEVVLDRLPDRGRRSRGSGQVRLKDVAALAGVSTATTSRVLTGKDYVSEELRLRVNSALRELNYTPDGVARSMSQGRTMSIGLVLSDVTNPFFTSVARGAEDAAQPLGYSVILCNTDEDVAKERKYLSILREKRVDGIMLAIANDQVDHIVALERAGVKLVLIDRAIPKLKIPTVEADNFNAVFEATRYLLRLGHQRIAMLTGNLAITTGGERLRGFEAALQEARLSVEPELLLPGGFHEDAAYEAGIKLARLADPPTAVISWGSAATTGLLLALRESGLRWPDDVSVVGFDDLPYFVLLDEPITAISQPSYEMGRRACELLLRLIDNEVVPADGELHVQLTTRLIIRKSCRRL